MLHLASYARCLRKYAHKLKAITIDSYLRLRVQCDLGIDLIGLCLRLSIEGERSMINHNTKLAINNE